MKRIETKQWGAVVVALFFGGMGLVSEVRGDEERLPSVIAFGSCAKEDREQKIWDAVVATEPGLFLFLGDNIYGDSEDVGVIEAKYRKLGAQPGYRKLLETGCPVMATWDDHDYGVNDGGVEFPSKKETQKALLDFFGVSEDSPRRSQEGVYDVRIFEKGGKRLQVILLDTRYFRSPLVKVSAEERARRLGPFRPGDDPEATILGDVQWKWLEEQLKVPADLRVIGTSIQAISEEHGWEKWGNFPKERARLLGLIRETRANGVVLLSGDRHMADISVIPKDAAEGVGYPLYDVTSSGLNMAGGGARDEANKWRVGPTNFQGLNFGVLRVDWGAEAPELVMEIRGVEGKVEQSASVKLGDMVVE